MKLVNVMIDQMQTFVIINNIRIVINPDVNVKNELTKEYVIKDLFGILVTVNVNVHLECKYTMKKKKNVKFIDANLHLMILIILLILNSFVLIMTLIQQNQ